MLAILWHKRIASKTRSSFFSPQFNSRSITNLLMHTRLKDFKTWFSRTQKTVPKDLWLGTWLYLIKTAQQRKIKECPKNLQTKQKHYISNPTNCFSTKATVLVELLSPTIKLYSHHIINYFNRQVQPLQWSCLNSQHYQFSAWPHFSHHTTLPIHWAWMSTTTGTFTAPISYTMNLPANSTVGLILSLTCPQLEHEHTKTTS